MPGAHLQGLFAALREEQDALRLDEIAEVDRGRKHFERSRADGIEFEMQLELPGFIG